MVETQRSWLIGTKHGLPLRDETHSHVYDDRITHELLGQLAHRQETFTQNPITTAQMGDLIDLVQSKRITGESAKIAVIPSARNKIFQERLASFF